MVSYFMPEMILNAGIKSTNKQLLINAINPIFSMLAAVYGATLLDRIGRRKMLMGGLIGGLFAYVLLTAFTAASEQHPTLAYGTIVSIYLFGICFAWGWTPLQTLYAVECLENRTRAKGSGLNFLFLNIAMVVNTYGISVGIESIGWKLYLVYIVWIVIELIVVFFCKLRPSRMRCIANPGGANSETEQSSSKPPERHWKNYLRSLRRKIRGMRAFERSRWAWTLTATWWT